jgi:formate dehydrogenase beta subunit
MSAAIRAIAAGRRGAASIHAHMYGLDIALPDQAVTSDSDIQNVDRVDNVPASVGQIMPVRSEPDSMADKESELGFTEEMARTEADRCLQCGLICYQRESAHTITLAPSLDTEIPAPAQEKLPETVGQPEIKSISQLGRIQ